MVKRMFSLMILSFVSISVFSIKSILVASDIENNEQLKTEYEIQDIGTLQTYESCVIAINNQGQIIGWYNIDGSTNGKRVFFKEKDGSFYEIPKTENGGSTEINWRYLADNGKVYGTQNQVLFLWDKVNGIAKLGQLPGEIVAINNSGQVLIKSIVDQENGQSIHRPAIWNNGKITKLKGLVGNIGIESQESYGFNMNNKGEVIGQSIINLNHKNKIYKQACLVKWSNGQIITLHKKFQNTNSNLIPAINDKGDILIDTWLIRNDGKSFFVGNTNYKLNSNNYLYNEHSVIDMDLNSVLDRNTINQKLLNEFDSIWMQILKIIGVNDKGEIIAQGETIYGEKHAILLSPIKSN